MNPRATVQRRGSENRPRDWRQCHRRVPRGPNRDATGGRKLCDRLEERSQPARRRALIFRIFDRFGSPVTSEITPNLVGFEKAMTLVDDGRFVIAHVRSQGVSDIGIEKSSVEANVFDANGALSNTAIPISSERGINSSWPAIALLQGGRFVLTWVQKSAETFATSPIVKAAVFSASEGSVGPEVQVNTTTAVGRSELSIATIPSTPEHRLHCLDRSQPNQRRRIGI